MDVLARIEDDPITSGLFAELLAQLTILGPHTVSPKKTSIHINGTRAFVGVHPRRAALLLNIVTDLRIISARVRKSEQVSAHRWHNEVLVTTGGDFDAELLSWIEHAYSLADPGATGG